MPSKKNLFSILTQVNKKVQRESQSKQHPFLYSGLTEEFYFSTPSVPHPTPGPDQNYFNLEDLEKRIKSQLDKKNRVG